MVLPVALEAGAGAGSIVQGTIGRKPWLALLLLGPALAGCSSASDILSRDADWFSRTGRVFTRSISIETPPLTPDRPVTAEDLVSADGACPGMTPAPGAGDANALADGAAGGAPAARGGTVALGHTECDVIRGIGVPDSVNLSNNGRDDQMTMITFSHSPRADIYTFTAGRLSSIERGPEPVAEPKAAKPKPKKKPAAT